MPEGDTIHRVANVLRRALAGRVVTGFEVVAPRMSSDAARFEFGKHLLITFARGDEDVVLHTHMKMTGMWHVYRQGERWWSPASDARAAWLAEQLLAQPNQPALAVRPESVAAAVWPAALAAAAVCSTAAGRRP